MSLNPQAQRDNQKGLPRSSEEHSAAGLRLSPPNPHHRIAKSPQLISVILALLLDLNTDFHCNSTILTKSEHNLKLMWSVQSRKLRT